jgi:hypothetical protein
MKIENIIRKVLREQEEEKLSELPPFDDFFDSDWNLVLNFMNRYPNKKFYYPGDLNLEESDIKSLGNLVRVEGDLNLAYSKIETLGNLVRVDGNLNLFNSKNLESLENLNYVGDALDLYGCKNLKSLGNLEYVGGWLDLRDTPLEEKYTEEGIRNMVEVDGKIYLSFK